MRGFLSLREARGRSACAFCGVLTDSALEVGKAGKEKMSCLGEDVEGSACLNLIHSSL